MNQAMNINKQKKLCESKINRKRKELRQAINEWNKSFDRYIDTAPKLESANLNGCKVLADRYELLKYMPKRSVVCEVGTYRGEFAQKIIETTNPEKLHIIDISFDKFDWENFKKKDINNISSMHEIESVAGLSKFPDRHFDWIYIDADHYFDGVLNDINIAKEKVKEEGYLVFNDYTTWSVAGVAKCGVARAVNQFCKDEGWKFVYFALHNNMYCDVAIQKM